MHYHATETHILKGGKASAFLSAKHLSIQLGNDQAFLPQARLGSM